MANRYAVATGNWSNTAIWDGGTLPQAGDVVRPNGYTVTIDQNVTVTELRNDASSPAVAGGTFTTNGNYTITANIYGLSTTSVCLSVTTASPNITTVIGAVIGTHLNSSVGLRFSGSGTLNLTGNVNAAHTSVPVDVTANGTVNYNGTLNINSYGQGVCIRVTGNAVINATGGINTTTTGIVENSTVTGINISAASAVVTFTGNITGSGSTNLSRSGILSSSTSTINFVGTINCVGVNGILITGASIVNITGDIYASTSFVGVSCSGGATISHISGVLYPSGNTPAIINSSYSATLLLQGSLANNGSVMPFYSPVMAITSSPLSWIVRGPTVGSTRTLYTLDALPANYTPAVTNVRSGITYNQGASTGTLVVPSAQYVSAGIPVDSGVGTLQHLTLNDLQAALAPNAPVGVERSVDDTKAISFSWPVSGASISGQKSVDYGAYSAVSGAISFLRTEGSRHYYSLAYSQYDRVSQEATIRYKMMDGTYTKYFNLRLVPPGITAQQIETQLNDDFSGVLTGISGIQSRLPATLVNGRMNATVGEMQTNVVTDTAVSAAAVTKIQSGILTTSQFNVRSLPSGQYALESTAQSLVTLVDAVPTVAEFEARTIPSGQYALQSTSQSLVTLVGDVPTVAEFEARTLPSGEYFLAGTSVDIASVSSGAVQDIFSTYPIAEDYAASGMAGTPAQILYFMQQTFSQFAISGVTISVKKLDGTTNAATFIMDSEKNPKSRTRVS